MLLSESEAIMKKLMGQILCWFGFHDFEVIDVIYEFGTKGVERDECQRCGVTRTRAL